MRETGGEIDAGNISSKEKRLVMHRGREKGRNAREAIAFEAWVIIGAAVENPKESRNEGRRRREEETRASEVYGVWARAIKRSSFVLAAGQSVSAGAVRGDTR